MTQAGALGGQRPWSSKSRSPGGGGTVVRMMYRPPATPHARTMPRQPRFWFPGAVLHVIQRRNNRAPVFVDDDDRRRLVDDLLAASRKHGVAVHAYVLMTNHVHLLATLGAADAMNHADRRAPLRRSIQPRTFPHLTPCPPCASRQPALHSTARVSTHRSPPWNDLQTNTQPVGPVLPCIAFALRADSASNPAPPQAAMQRGRSPRRRRPALEAVGLAANAVAYGKPVYDRLPGRASRAAFRLAASAAVPAPRPRRSAPCRRSPPRRGARRTSRTP